jgi:hypothetical protein
VRRNHGSLRGVLSNAPGNGQVTRNRILRVSWFAAQRQEPRPDSSEPQLPPVRVPQQVGSTALSQRSPALVLPDQEREPLPSPATTASPSGTVMGDGVPAATLLSLALVGLVAVIIGASFGAEFFLLTAPAKEMTAASERNPAAPPLGSSRLVSISLASGMSRSAGSAATIRDFPPPLLREGKDDLTNLPSGNLAPAAPAMTSAHPRSAQGSTAGRVESATMASAKEAGIRPSTPEASTIDRGVPLANHEAAAHPQIASQRPRYRSAPDRRSPSPLQSRLPRSWSPSQSERARLAGQVPTRPSEEAKQSLTAPAAGAPDPFARRGADGSPPQ